MARVVEKRRFSAKSFRARHKGLKFPWYELKNDYNTSKFDILCSRFSVLMARVVELVDTRDLKSLGLKSRAGSIPAPGTSPNALIHRHLRITLEVVLTSLWSALFARCAHHVLSFTIIIAHIVHMLLTSFGKISESKDSL